MYLHLFVCWANLTFSDENCSSRSNRSRQGGGNSLNCGGNTWKDWGKIYQIPNFLYVLYSQKKSCFIQCQGFFSIWFLSSERQKKLWYCMVYHVDIQYTIFDRGTPERGPCFFSWSFLSSLMVVNHSHGFQFKLIFT